MLAVMPVTLPLRVEPVIFTWRDWLLRVMVWGARTVFTFATAFKGT